MPRSPAAPRHRASRPTRPERALLALLALFAASLARGGERGFGPGRQPERVEAREGLVDRPDFLRLSRDDDGKPLSLDTSIVEYHRPAGGRREPLQVDLVAAVHIGSRDYYDTLDRLFADYDAVLYELVAPPNARVPKPGRKAAGAIGSAQQGLKSMLGLEFQLDSVDYSAANFVHADLTPREFDAAMAKRGESWWSMFTRLMRESMARADKRGAGEAEVGMGELVGILFGSAAERQLRLRRVMAEQFTDMDALTAAFGGEEGSTLITDRNAAALDVLRTEIAAGKRRIAIFYGAAHMDDFDRQLQDDFDLEPGETTWLEAWNLRDQPAAPAEAAERN
jgi:hypothetical protein